MTEYVVALLGHKPTTQPYIFRDDYSRLNFRSVDPGGFASVNLDLARPMHKSDFDTYSHVAVHNAHTGRCVGGGRLLRPGKTLDRSGEVWEVAALGEGFAHMKDIQRPLFLIDSEPDRWKTESFRTTKNITWSKAEPPVGGGDEGLLVSLTETVKNGKRGDARYYRIHEAEQFIAGYHFEFIAGIDSGSSMIKVIVRNTGLGTQIITNGGGAGQTFDKETTRTHGTRLNVAAGWNDAEQFDTVFLAYERTTSDLVTTDDYWAHINVAVVKALRYGRDGQYIVDPVQYEPEELLAHEVVTDIWARLCPRFDLANAHIDIGNYGHKTLAWDEGVTAMDVIDHLREQEPAFTWAVWERQRNGLWRAEWRNYDLTVRYELVAHEDLGQYREVGYDDDQFSVVWVQKAAESGLMNNTKWSFVSSQQTDAESAGIVRERVVRFPDSGDYEADSGAGVAEATIGNASMASAAVEVDVGTKVYDHHTHRFVGPEEIRPGYLCRTRGVGVLKPNHLNAKASADRVIARIVGNDHDAEAGVSKLQLNGVSYDEATAIVNLLNARTHNP